VHIEKKMDNKWIGIIAISIFGLIFYITRLAKMKKSLSSLRKREILSDDEIYERFYALSGLNKTTVIEIWHEIADALDVPAGYIRPYDIFGENIGVYWITSEELDALSNLAERRMKRQKLSVDLVLIKTVDNYVNEFAAYELE
jgi:hypothetical protein